MEAGWHQVDSVVAAALGGLPLVRAGGGVPAEGEDVGDAAGLGLVERLDDRGLVDVGARQVHLRLAAELLLEVRAAKHGSGESQLSALESHDSCVRSLKRKPGHMRALLGLGLIDTEPQDGNQRKKVPDVPAGRSGWEKVVGPELESEIGGRASGAPRDVDEHRLELGHALDTLVQVHHTCVDPRTSSARRM